MPSRSDYYRVLHVSKQATPADIKAAFRRLARQYHPDLNPDNPRAAAEFQRINEAYQALSEPESVDPRRTTYQRPTSPAYQRYYIDGVQQSAQQNYQRAIDAFTQAIQLNDQYLEAYFGRCQARYALGDDRGAIEDGYRILKLNPEFSQAHYYQGRARSRLGYTESSLAAYTRAIQIEPNYAAAYYYRGIAHEELRDRKAAKRDWLKAADLFQSQGDFSGFKKVRTKLRPRAVPPFTFPSPKFKSIQILPKSLVQACKLLPSILVNPGGELLPAFGRLSTREAAAIGIFWAAIANLVAIASLPLYIPTRYTELDVVVLSWTAFLSLVVASAISRLVTRSRGSWSGDLFVAGATTLPLSLFALLGGLAPSMALMIAAGILTGSYIILTLYIGCTQIHNFLERSAAMAVPLMVMVSGGITAWVATQLLP